MIDQQALTQAIHNDVAMTIGQGVIRQIELANQVNALQKQVDELNAKLAEPEVKEATS